MHLYTLPLVTVTEYHKRKQSCEMNLSLSGKRLIPCYSHGTFFIGNVVLHAFDTRLTQGSFFFEKLKRIEHRFASEPFYIAPSIYFLT